MQLSFALYGLPAPSPLPGGRGVLPLLLVCNAVVLAVLGAAELALRLRFRYGMETITGSGLIVSYGVYFMIQPFADGAQLALLLPVMVALVYFDRRLLIGLILLGSMFYTVIYVVLERMIMHKPLLEFLLVQGLFAMFAALAYGVLLRFGEASHHLQQLARSEQELLVERAISDKLLKMDALTGLYNHKTFHEYLDSLLEQCETHGLPLQIGLLDIDNFKRINDTYGHWVGDLVLKEVAAEIRSSIGLNDFAARYGGEEFAVIYTEGSLPGAKALTERLRVAIAKMEHPYADGRQITVSVGLCDYRRGMGKEALFRSADEALYLAKRSGKNRVVSAGANECGERKDRSREPALLVGNK